MRARKTYNLPDPDGLHQPHNQRLFLFCFGPPTLGALMFLGYLGLRWGGWL